MKTTQLLIGLLLGTSFLSSEVYQLINLTELYEESPIYKEKVAFKPWKINNEEEIVGTVRTELPSVTGRRATKWAVAYGSIQNNELELIVHDTGVIQRLFLNDQGIVVGTQEISKQSAFSWDPLLKTFLSVPTTRCLEGSHVTGLDEENHALVHCKLTEEKTLPYIWSTEKNKLKEIGPPLFQLINDNGVLYYTTPTTEGGLSAVTMKVLKEDMSVTHPSLPMNLIPIQVNTWSHMLFYGTQLRTGPVYLMLWNPQESKKIAEGQNSTHVPLINNQNQIIYHNGKEFMFYENGDEDALESILFPPPIPSSFFKILNVLDLNDNGSLLVRGYLKDEKKPQYYLLKAAPGDQIEDFMQFYDDNNLNEEN